MLNSLYQNKRRSLRETGRPSLILLDCQILHTSCTYAVTLTWLPSWHEKDVERRACDPVFTSLIPSKTYRSSNTAEKTLGGLRCLWGNALWWSVRRPVAVAYYKHLFVNLSFHFRLVASPILNRLRDPITFLTLLTVSDACCLVSMVTFTRWWHQHTTPDSFLGSSPAA